MAAFLSESLDLIGPLFVLAVIALSLAVILPVVNRWARRLEATSARRLLDLSRGDAIKRLKIDLGALSNRLRATEEELYQSSIRLTRLGFPYVERPRGQGLSFPLLTSYGSGAPICPAFVCGPWAAGLDDVRNKTGHTNQRARLARWESRPVSHRDVVPWRSSLIECTLPLVGRRCRRPIP